MWREVRVEGKDEKVRLEGRTREVRLEREKGGKRSDWRGSRRSHVGRGQTGGEICGEVRLPKTGEP